MSPTWRRAAAGLLAAALAYGLAACSSADPAPAAPRAAASSVSGSPSPKASATPTPERPPASPLTGRTSGRIDGPVVVVKIDNSGPARPATNLDKADVVYLEPVEAGLTRIAAVFSSQLPDRIGPVRSGRASDIELFRQYGRVAFAYSGAQRRVLRLIRKAPWYDLNPATAGGSFERDFGRLSPYNLYVRTDPLLERAPKATEPNDVGFRFGAAPAGGTSAESVTATWQRARATFTWSAADKRWYWEMDGRAQRTTAGDRVGAENVIVQYVTIKASRFRDVNGAASPDVDTVGRGKAVLLRDGKAYRVTWSRPSAAKPTRWTVAGKDANLAVGRTWIVLLDKRTPARLR